MADCELCTRARPLLIPIKAPVHSLAWPEGTYRGVCDICLITWRRLAGALWPK
jgi:hypothetical protein